MASGISLIELKAIFSGLVFIGGGVGVLLPWALGRGERADRWMAWGDAFAGGVLGGAGLVHLLSGGADEFRALAPALKYPLAFLLAGAGFLLILLIEAVIVVDHPDPSVSLLHVRSGNAGHEIGHQCPAARPHPAIYLLLLVLSIHSAIVGVALGAQRSASNALIVFIAIAAHKMMAGFALGISYRRAGATLSRTTSVAGFFSSMTSLGILAGTAAEAHLILFLPACEPAEPFRPDRPNRENRELLRNARCVVPAQRSRAARSPGSQACPRTATPG